MARPASAGASAGRRATQAPPGCRSGPAAHRSDAQQLPARLSGRYRQTCTSSDARPTLRDRAGGDAFRGDRFSPVLGRAAPEWKPAAGDAPVQRVGHIEAVVAVALLSVIRTVISSLIPPARGLPGQPAQWQQSRQDSLSGKSKPTNTLSSLARAAISHSAISALAARRVGGFTKVSATRSPQRRQIQMLSRPIRGRFAALQSTHEQVVEHQADDTADFARVVGEPDIGSGYRLRPRVATRLPPG